MKLLSKDFKNGEHLPKELGCDLGGKSPELHWAEAPAETKSFAVTVSDPDAPGGTYYHWLVCNIPKSVSIIPNAGPLPSGAKEIPNNSGRARYVAPCPPSGTHRYYFRLYALDTEKLDCRDAEDFLPLVEKHKIAQAEIMCPFKRH